MSARRINSQSSARARFPGFAERSFAGVTRKPISERVAPIGHARMRRFWAEKQEEKTEKTAPAAVPGRSLRRSPAGA